VLVPVQHDGWQRVMRTKVTVSFVQSNRKQDFTILKLFGIGHLIGLNKYKKVSVSLSVSLSVL
jgi:hypothetical protein